MRDVAGGFSCAMDLPTELDDGQGSWSHVEPFGVSGQLDVIGQVSEYEPSLLSDFHAMLPVNSDISLEQLEESYNPELVVQSAWKSLANKEMELPWEGGFLGQISGSKHSGN